ncbi:MAG: inorganic diphosphatase [Candidatus Aenigmatarchaeota archaeon]|nr:inorganic diphosphatase [Candidatus Aenigmarchaeota archaeon]
MAELSTGPNPPEEVYVLVRVSSGSKYQYSMRKDPCSLMLDKVLPSPLPVAYGIIPATHHTDAETLDAFVLVSEPPMPGSIISARPVGLMRIEGEGKIDDKIIAVCSIDREFDDLRDVADVPKHTLAQLTSAIKEDWVSKITWLDAEKAKKAVQKAIELYKRGYE